MNEIPVPCRDCINEPTCDAECTGHLTEAEWEAVRDDLIRRFSHGFITQEPNETEVSNTKISY